MSSHLWPEISAQLLSVTPTAHWLEYADWWNAVVKEPLTVKDGFATAFGLERRIRRRVERGGNRQDSCLNRGAGRETGLHKSWKT